MKTGYVQEANPQKDEKKDDEVLEQLCSGSLEFEEKGYLSLQFEP